MNEQDKPYEADKIFSKYFQSQINLEQNQLHAQQPQFLLQKQSSKTRQNHISSQVVPQLLVTSEQGNRSSRLTNNNHNGFINPNINQLQQQKPYNLRENGEMVRKPEIKRDSRMLNEVIKGQSNIEYFPFERKVIEYEEKERIERVPKSKTITQYREEKRQQLVPREIIKEDYYAIEHIKQYMPQYVEQKYTQMVEVKVPFKRIQYVPVHRDVMHHSYEMLPGCVPPPNTQMFSHNPHQHTNSVNAYHHKQQPQFQHRSGQMMHSPQIVNHHKKNNFSSHPINRQQNSHFAQNRVISQSNNQGVFSQSSYNRVDEIYKKAVTQSRLKQLYTLYDNYETYIPSIPY